METKDKTLNLTDREKEIIVSIAGGFNDNETGEKLGIKPTSLRQMVKAILDKTQSNNRAQLIFWATQNNII